MAEQSSMKVNYYQDRTEFQSRGNLSKDFDYMHLLTVTVFTGNAHIHGSAWSDFKKLEKIYPGLQIVFLKLKERHKLEENDLYCIVKFLNDNITCTLSVKNIMKFGISEHRAEFISQTVKEVNIHHHTKTCRKYETDCRFLFPRYPSDFHIISQEYPEMLTEDEKGCLWMKIGTVLKEVKSLLGVDKVGKS